jgi:peptidoglycan hydrolase CwlO-like protein
MVSHNFQYSKFIIIGLTAFILILSYNYWDLYYSNKFLFDDVQRQLEEKGSIISDLNAQKQKLSDFETSLNENINIINRLKNEITKKEGEIDQVRNEFMSQKQNLVSNLIFISVVLFII